MTLALAAEHLRALAQRGDHLRAHSAVTVIE
jgi:hypothetical protein